MARDRLATGLILLVVHGAGFSGCAEPADPERTPAAERAPSVLLVTLDTTRADRLGSYGYDRGTTPNLDRLAADSVVHLNAVSTSSWTLPSHASLFTGKYPLSHGARFDPRGPLVLADGIDAPEAWQEYRARGLARDEVTLAHLLGDRGYRTAAIVGGPWMKRVFGLDAGFEAYDDSLVTDVDGGRAEDVSDRALAFVREHGHERFFLFLNYYDPHGPYGPPWDFRLRLGPRYWFAPAGDDPDANSHFYDAEIAYVDRHLGRLLDVLRARGLYDDMLVVVTADHGELLGEHGKYGHGLDLTQQELHVPLIVKHPGGERAGERSAARVSNTAVSGLILEAVGIEVPDEVQARIPRETLAPLLAETHPLPAISDTGSWRALFLDGYKLVWNSKRGYRLYDLERDPSERFDLTEERPERAQRMRVALAKWIERAPKPGDAGPEQRVDAGTRRALQSLGYLE